MRYETLPELDFVLTPQERTGADMARLHLEAHRRRLNERDARQRQQEPRQDARLGEEATS
ncbi:hypothetical protein [Lysobacter sp. ESA13C]|uniref:hypothetical protein n=1 Tax=Lysobacter sp. ESA13C TaxID=2862676 RepID=UPI001CBCE00B|nr:hypothetical protein [Lysobacter sp. ESA13C]